MKTITKTFFILVVALVLGGCVSPNIVIQPALPNLAAGQSVEGLTTVRLVTDATESSPQLNPYEEKSNKTLIGKSESLGVHLSDFWLEEQPAVMIQRLLESDLRAWGYKVATNNEQVQLHVHVNRFSLESRSINLFVFQADGVIDVALGVSKLNAAPHYKRDYVATCTFKTATEIPNKENMEKLFGQCIEQFQKQLETDTNLRSALSGN